MKIHERCAVLIAVGTTRWFELVLKERAGLSRERRMSGKRRLNVALEQMDVFEEIDGKDCTWENLAGALEKAIEQHCSIDRERRSRGLPRRVLI